MTTVQGVRTVAAKLFPGPGLWMTVQRARPLVCPFHELIARVPFGSTVLDIGCGSGLFLGLLATNGRLSRGLGFDPSTLAITAAKAMKRNVASPSLLEFQNIGVDETWPDERFDVVAMIDVMHHLPLSMRQDALHQAVERLRPGGLLLYKDMAASPQWRAWGNRMHDLVMAREWIRYQPVETVEDLLFDCGLMLRERNSFNILWYGHELRVFSA